MVTHTTCDTEQHCADYAFSLVSVSTEAIHLLNGHNKVDWEGVLLKFIDLQQCQESSSSQIHTGCLKKIVRRLVKY